MYEVFFQDKLFTAIDVNQVSKQVRSRGCTLYPRTHLLDTHKYRTCMNYKTCQIPL